METQETRPGLQSTGGGGPQTVAEEGGHGRVDSVAQGGHVLVQGRPAHEGLQEPALLPPGIEARLGQPPDQLQQASGVRGAQGIDPGLAHDRCEPIYERLVEMMDTLRVVQVEQDDELVMAELFPAISIGDAPPAKVQTAERNDK